MIDLIKPMLISVSELSVIDNPANSVPSNVEMIANSLANSSVNIEPKSPLTSIASVLVPLVRKEGEWHILLTLRAENMRHHGGEVAFPGGMWEQGDEDLVITALRECEEEIAIAPHSVSILGGLLPSFTRSLTRVRPIVGIIHSMEGMTANPREIAAIFTVPLAFFITDSRIRTDVFTRQDSGLTHWVPAYDYQGYEIWGFTSAVIVQLINRCFASNNSAGGGFSGITDDVVDKIMRPHSAPEKVWI